MFVLKEHETFDWDVKAKVPREGQHDSVKFKARFNLLDVDVVERLAINPDTRDQREFLKLALVKFWDMDVVDEQGAEVKEDERRNEIILKKVIFLEALSTAYGHGAHQAKSKN